VRIAVLASLLLVGCASAAPASPKLHAAKQVVPTHYLVLVSEGKDDEHMHDTIVVAEPLERVPELKAAFAFKSAGFSVGVGRGDNCLDVTVMRDDLEAGSAEQPADAIRVPFKVAGCVPYDELQSTVGRVEHVDGSSITVVVWMFNEGSAGAPLPPRSRKRASTFTPT
jgi:hypothetical protein